MKHVFNCHASEDKDDVVLPLVSAFDANGISSRFRLGAPRLLR